MTLTLPDLPGFPIAEYEPPTYPLYWQRGLEIRYGFFRDGTTSKRRKGPVFYHWYDTPFDEWVPCRDAQCTLPICCARRNFVRDMTGALSLVGPEAEIGALSLWESSTP